MTCTLYTSSIFRFLQIIGTDLQNYTVSHSRILFLCIPQSSFVIMNMNSVSATNAYNRRDRFGTHVPLFSKEQIGLVLGFIL